MFHTTTVTSPVGELRLIAGLRGLRAILWNAEDAAHIACIDNDDLIEARTAVLDQAVSQLDEYFAGTRREFDLPSTRSEHRSSSRRGWCCARSLRPHHQLRTAGVATR